MASQPATGTATVTVGCKIPNGLHLDLGGKRVTLNGSHSSRVIGGYGLTEGVPADFFEAWLQTYADSPAVTNGLVFAQENAADVRAQALDQADIRTGLEPLDPTKPGRDLAPEDPKKLAQQLQQAA